MFEQIFKYYFVFCIWSLTNIDHSQRYIIISFLWMKMRIWIFNNKFSIHKNWFVSIWRIVKKNNLFSSENLIECNIIVDCLKKEKKVEKCKNIFERSVTWGIYLKRLSEGIINEKFIITF